MTEEHGKADLLRSLLGGILCSDTFSGMQRQAYRPEQE